MILHPCSRADCLSHDDTNLTNTQCHIANNRSVTVPTTGT